MGWVDISLVDGVLQNKSDEKMAISDSVPPTIKSSIVLQPLEIIQTVAGTAKAILVATGEDPIYAVSSSVTKGKTGGGGSYTLPTMSDTIKGGAKVGDGLQIDTATEKLSGKIATQSTLGMIKAGDNIVIDPTTAHASIPKASAKTLGVVAIGDGIGITSNAEINITAYKTEIDDRFEQIASIQIGSSIPAYIPANTVFFRV